MADENGSNQNLPVTSKALYREDLIRHATSRDRIGIVLLNGLDSESSSESEDEEGDKVAEGHVLVSWYPKGHEEEIEEAKVGQGELPVLYISYQYIDFYIPDLNFKLRD